MCRVSFSIAWCDGEDVSWGFPFRGSGECAGYR